MRADDNSIYEFGPYRLLTPERLLLRDGKSVPLAPKVFETLLAFVRNSGQLLSKNELMDLIWGETVVEEGNLTQNIFILRKVLGETPHDHRYLVTIPLQGYRFVAPVRKLSPSEIQQGFARSQSPDRISRLTTIAVLPLTLLNVSGVERFEGVGVADTLITKLNGLQQIIVRPTTAVMKYAKDKDNLERVGDELSADFLLDGTIQINGERIRVNVQLFNVHQQRTVWAEKYDEKYSDIFVVQDSIATKVADALELRLSKDEVRQLTKSHTESLDAYQLYIKGRYFWETRTEEGLKKALAYAQDAIDVDENNAIAHVGVADSYAFLAEYLYVSPNEAFPKAKQAALKAQQLDPKLAEAFASLAEVNFFYEWEWVQAERNYRQAIEMKPNYASAHLWYAWLLMATRRFDEALAAVRRAQMIDPGSLTLNTIVGLPFYFEGYYDQAVAQFRNTLEMDAGFTQARYYLGSALCQLGQFDEAASELQAVSRNEYWQQASALLAFVHARSNKHDRARKLLAELQSASKTKYISPYLLAIVHTGLNEVDKAFAYLQEGLNERAAWLVFVAVDPFLNDLRADSRFEGILQQLNFLNVS